MDKWNAYSEMVIGQEFVYDFAGDGLQQKIKGTMLMSLEITMIKCADLASHRICYIIGYEP